MDYCVMSRVQLCTGYENGINVIDRTTVTLTVNCTATWRQKLDVRKIHFHIP